MKHNQYGPSLRISQEIDAQKYRQKGEDFYGKIVRISAALMDSSDHFEETKDILRNMRFLPAGRIQTAIGAMRQTTAYNCFVSGTIEDSMPSIMNRANEAAETMRRGGGIGYDFSRIRPKGDRIKTLDSRSSGPISYMSIYDAVCQTISSAGHRRGAQMGVLRIDHPDIETFISCKQNSSSLTGFNLSIGVTDEFMRCLLEKRPFTLRFNGEEYQQIDPEALWDMIMRSTWDWAEPGVLFIDTINRMNNLRYCEEIAATNPCGEQPLPPYGACLLGSFNLTKYVNGIGQFDFDQLVDDIPVVVRAMDNVIDRTIYPLPEQEREAKSKRRMGLGVTGLANAAELCGHPYASEGFMAFTEQVLVTLRDTAYSVSADLAAEKGSFPMYDERYFGSEFIQTLPEWLIAKIRQNGIRNSHLLSLAPTGTISLMADNISSGIEPPFSLQYDRDIFMETGLVKERIMDYAWAKGVRGRTANEITAQQHLDVLALCTKYVDSAVSKTCNVGDDVTYAEFRDLYRDAWQAGCKGITTFRAAGKRYGIMTEVKEEEASACFYDPETGKKTCE